MRFRITVILWHTGVALRPHFAFLPCKIAAIIAASPCPVRAAIISNTCFSVCASVPARSTVFFCTQVDASIRAATSVIAIIVVYAHALPSIGVAASGARHREELTEIINAVVICALVAVIAIHICRAGATFIGITCLTCSACLDRAGAIAAAVAYIVFGAGVAIVTG